MKKLLLSTLIAIGCMGYASARTVTLVRSENISQGSIHVLLRPFHALEEPMRLANGETEKSFELPKGTYTKIGYDYMDVWEPIHCDHLHINVTNSSRHIIQLTGDPVKQTITCTVKDD